MSFGKSAASAGGFDSLDAALASYEADRKFAVSRLGFNSVVLGAVETLAPEGARDSFFRTTGALGVARAAVRVVWGTATVVPLAASAGEPASSHEISCAAS